ncbi:zinc finger protein 57-like isoform X19 [Leptidea sinapis]|nr:zinc finger protein 57-like isoform X19 [Leptidea sinapis]
MMILTQNRTNLREILRVSNATPLCSRNGIGYKCCLCANVYPNPADLKEHFIKKHDMSKSISSKDINKISGREFRKLSVKLDITNLSCRVCQLEIADLKELLNHLKSTHTNTVTPDVQNHILPFKFFNDVIQCCACAKEFNSFKTILEHMNKHTQNYICSYCSAGYLNKCALELHEGRHKKGEHRCKFCPKIFETLSKRQNHERSYHLCVDRLNKCWHCDERFSSNFRKQMHMLEVHGIQQPAKEKVLCKICNKHYPNKNLYNKHIRRVHLGEKNHKCKFCEKEFFVAKGLNDHLVSHTGEKKFQCYYCMKAFGRKSTLREHIRIHVNDKRFSCADCGQRFTQKCSWRSHMLSKHGERV